MEEQWKNSGWLGRLNYFALQWVCVRLYKVAEDDGSISGWGFLYWVKPGSGWRDSETGEGSEYAWLQGKKGDLRLI